MEIKLHTLMVVFKSFNAKNFYYNRKEIRITFNAIPIICVSSDNDGKTQVRWVISIRRKTQM
jgi:hypothetical protein